MLLKDHISDVIDIGNNKQQLCACRNSLRKTASIGLIVYVLCSLPIVFCHIMATSGGGLPLGAGDLSGMDKVGVQL